MESESLKPESESESTLLGVRRVASVFEIVHNFGYLFYVERVTNPQATEKLIFLVFFQWKVQSHDSIFIDVSLIQF